MPGKSEDNTMSWLSNEIATRLAQTIGSMLGSEASASWEDVGAPVPSEGLLWWEQPLSFPPSSAICCGASREVWNAIGSGILEAAGVPPDEETVRSTYCETITQAVSATARALSSRFGIEVSCAVGREMPAAPASTVTPIAVSAKAGDISAGPLFVVFSNTLAAAFRQPASSPSEGVRTQSEASPQSRSTMDLLYDVELPVSVSFGRAELPLRDVIKLTMGSIVELNRSITEPVEIIVNNCVIARGQVVVVEGNYGVRIDQIITRQERLRTLR